MCVLNCSVVSNSLWPHGLWPTRLLCPWDFPGKNTSMGCHFLLQGIFLTQGSNPPCLLSLLHCKRILHPLSHLPKLNRLFFKVMTDILNFYEAALKEIFNDVPLFSAQDNVTTFSHHPHHSFSLVGLCPWTCSKSQVEIGALTPATTKKFRMIVKANVDARGLKQNTGQNRLEISHIVFIGRHKSRVSGSKLACGDLKGKTSSFLPQVESGVFRSSGK